MNIKCVNSKIEVRLDELLSSLSIALDLTENKSLDHSRRTAYISYRIAEKLNVNQDIKENVYYASFLHDIGISNMPYQGSLEEIHSSLNLKKAHSDMGYKIVKNLPFDEDISKYILYHHENYDGSGPNFIARDDIPIGAQIISIGDYFDIAHKRGDISNKEKERMRELIKSNKNKKFNPEIVEALLELMETDKFWLDLSINLNYEVMNLITPEKVKLITIDELGQIAKAFSVIIDGKSKFTHLHSTGLANNVYKVAKYIGFDEQKSRKMEIAGYLHDIGKLAVPNYILDKPGKLTVEEFNIIKTHAYWTKLILSQVKSFRDDIAQWAGNHHEKLNGQGYPEKLKGDEITKEDQIVGICDIYQALTEDRPYRKGMDKLTALSIIKDIVYSGGFDEKIYKLFKEAI
ncbi:HD-GYP domain-containing protein [Tepidibacter thalassicus]|uniref:HD domain-containing protein n=1 Tax=Tepidibacter thalassicus DSM 15285 TaxID=1123350 RepID=A0A1M5RY27_9FIRM|nr:HD domain-containing phosphohydrolase [Tepidibacter thalassicus]SHH31084.1 HD domain-containing protein [Tepidibacter thalassicus DSM 15285]